MRYLSTEHESVLRNESGYEVEDGIVIDPLDKAAKPFTREHNATFNFVPAAEARLRAIQEELEWARRSGPVFIIHRPQPAA